MLTCWAPGKARAIQGFGGWLLPWLSQQLLQPPCDSQGCLGLQGWDLPSCEGRTDRMDRGYCSALPPVISSCCPQPCSLPLSRRLALVSTRPLKELRKSLTPNTNPQEVSPQVISSSCPFSPDATRQQGLEKAQTPPLLHSALVSPPDILPCSGKPGEHPAWLVAFILTKRVRRSLCSLFLGTSLL